MSELYHHGILGQKWGVRRYQNPDGTLTSAGRRRNEKALALFDKRIDSNKKEAAEHIGKVITKLQKKKVLSAKDIDNAEKKVNDILKNSWQGMASNAIDISARKIVGDDADSYNHIANRLHDERLNLVRSVAENSSAAKAERARLESQKQQVSSTISTVQKGARIAGNTIAKGVTKGVNIGANLAAKDLTTAASVVNKGFQKGTKAAADWTDEKYKKRVKHSSESEEAIKTNWVKTSDKDELTHWGVPGMRWGHRRYQNTDGSLTTLGEIHYGVGSKKERRSAERAYIKTKEAEDRAYVKKMKSDQKTAKKIADYEAKTKRDAEKAAKKQEEEDLRAKRKREKRVNKEIEKEEREAQKKAEAEKKAEDKETRKKLEEENAQKAKEAKDAEKKEQAEQKQEAKAEKQQAKQEAKEAKKKEAEDAKREEQIKKDTEKVQEAMKEKPQNEEAKPERKPVSAEDYKDVSSALKTTSENIGSMKALVNVIEGARQRNAVRNAVGERKLDKPISEMTDQEINATVNRWASEDRIANATVGARSRAADNITTALDVVGNLTLQSSRAFSIASNIRSIVERR